MAGKAAAKDCTASDESCLVAKLGAYVDLSEDELALLRRFEAEEQTYQRRKVVRRQGEEASNLFVVKEGWCFTFVILPDGGRQVLDLHFPGDIVGQTSISFEKASSGIASATRVTLCPFPKAHLDKVFLTAPRLTALLYSMAMLENVVLIDRLKSVGRMEARDRVAHFLLQILTRLRVTDTSLTARFHLPISQELIGDALGLSAIHVNRTFRRLEEEGAIAREGQFVQILDEPRLVESVDFSNRFYRIETGWFPR